MSNPTLAELYASHTGKVSDKWSSYLPTYDRLFAHLRDQPISLLEIGVQNGGSLEIWAKYFPHPEALIVGVDINDQCSFLRYNDSRIWVALGDATKEPSHIKTDYNIIIDDGSHHPQHQLDAFRAWFPVLKNGGIYVIEDMHCDNCIYALNQLEVYAHDLVLDRPAEYAIARVEILNSMLVFHKGDGSLGPRIVAGTEQSICPVLHLNGEVRRG